MVISVAANSPTRTVRDLIAARKPGASPRHIRTGSLHDLVGELVNVEAGSHGERAVSRAPALGIVDLLGAGWT